MKATQEAVYDAAAGASPSHEQEPAYYDQVRGNACLSETCRTMAAAMADSAKVEEQIAPEDIAPQAQPLVDDEMKLWTAIQNSTNPAEFAAFLEAYPDSMLARVARIRLAATELAYWQSVPKLASRAELARYLSYYPEGAHAAEVQTRLAALEASGGETEVTTDATEESEGQPQAETEVAALEAEPETPPMSEHDLHVALQEVLKRVGCYSGRIDGDWGRRSQSALEKLAQQRDLTGAAEPSVEMFEQIRAYDERICSETAAPVRPAATGTHRAPVVIPPEEPAAAPAPQTAQTPPPTGTESSNSRNCVDPSPASPNFGMPLVEFYRRCRAGDL